MPRPSQAREIDLVFELDDGRVTALEVTSAQSVSRDDFRHLSWLREQRALFALPIEALWRL